MRLLGIALLVGGFLWIAADAVVGFVGHQHLLWIWHSQNLPEGETIKRTEAVSAMRKLSLALKDRHRVVVVPALLMLAGGGIAAFSRKRKSDEKSAAPIKICERS